jgi:hypothetical protein
MSLLFALALASAAPPPRLTFDGVPFGERRALRCIWFTNFENSRFEQCRDARGPLLREGDGASIACVPILCKRLDAAARKASARRGSDPPSGLFTIRIVGRLSVVPRTPRYLGDATRSVLVEEVISVARR